MGGVFVLLAVLDAEIKGRPMLAHYLEREDVQHEREHRQSQ